MRDTVRITEYAGPREALRPLFELAEDSPAELDSYVAGGLVLVAVDGGRTIGHLQLTGAAPEVEVKNMAVVQDRRGEGVGSALMTAAIGTARVAGATRVVVATGAADVGNLRFYQRQGFRMLRIERDAFTEATGYAPDTVVDGVPLRDRVWLDREL